MGNRAQKWEDAIINTLYSWILHYLGLAFFNERFDKKKNHEIGQLLVLISFSCVLNFILIQVMFNKDKGN